MQHFDVTAPDAAGVPALRQRLVFSLCFLAPLLYLGAAPAAGLPLPGFLAGAPGYGLAQLALALPLCWANRAFFCGAWQELRRGAPGMDTLVALGAGAALLYGVFAVGMSFSGDSAGAARQDLPVSCAAMILTLVTLGKLLEAFCHGKTTGALQSLLRLTPETACLLRDGQEVSVPVAEVCVGDLFVVRPGGWVPVDGEVTEGSSTVDEAALTGAHAPVDKAPGSAVSAATRNVDSALTCRATHVGQDTTLAQVVRLVQNADAAKAPLTQTADRLGRVFVPGVIALATVTFVVWLLLGQTLPFALARAISVLLIGCPCALGLAAPVAVLVGSGVGARRGILFKTAASLVSTGRTHTLLLDKTGTITTGAPTVTEVIGTRKVPAKFLLGMAAGLEAQSEDPLAHAVLQKAQAEGITVRPLPGCTAGPGQGLQGRLAGKVMAGGSAEFIAAHCALTPDLAEAGARLEEAGVTPLYFSLDGHPAGLIGISEDIKPTSKAAIAQLQALGLQVVLLTGDAPAAARHLGRLVGLTETQVLAGVPDAGKADEVRRLQAQGCVAMVGDGVHAAPALALADTGIALGAGGDLAQCAADVVLLRSDLTDVPAAVRLSRAVAQTIRQNLFWAFLYNAVCIPLAAGLFYGFGVLLSPVVAAAAMSLSSLCVVANALRLDRFDPLDPAHDAPPDPSPRKGDA